MVKVIGTHCYLGGFLIGLQEAGLEIVASAETWKPGMKGAKALGLPVKSVSEVLSKTPKADIVVGNPPCSRFSHLSFSFFKDKEGIYDDLSTFPEVNEVVNVGLLAGTRVVWWETGPLAWRAGRKLIQNCHERLRAFWGQASTLVVRLDLRYIGIPQRRPRVHIIHAPINVPPPSVPAASWPIDLSVGAWIVAQVRGQKLENAVCTEESRDPLQWACERNLNQKFRSMVPKVIRYDDQYALAVVSRRIMVWEDENRFWDFLEHAALMTYPLDKVANILPLVRRPVDAQVLLSKSVAPAASAWVAEKILLPWLNNEYEMDSNRTSTAGEGGFGKVFPSRWGNKLWQLDLDIKDRKKTHDKRQFSFW